MYALRPFPLPCIPSPSLTPSLTSSAPLAPHGPALQVARCKHPKAPCGRGRGRARRREGQADLVTAAGRRSAGAAGAAGAAGGVATSLDEALIAEFLDSCMGAFRPTVVGQGARSHARDRLEHRRLPGCWRQLVAPVHRYELKLFRAHLEKLAGFAISFLGAFVLASNSGPSKDFDSLMFMSLFLLLICFGCLEILAALKCYQRDRVVVWRESSSGVSMLAYFVARNVCKLPVLAYRAVIFTAVTASVIGP